MQNFLHGIGEYITPVLKESRFRQAGVLSPEEFQKSGDFLVFKCPTWQWQSGDADRSRSWLPTEKQYLVTRNVTCARRVKDIESMVLEDAFSEEGWISSTLDRNCAGPQQNREDDEIPDIDELDIADNLIADVYDPAEYRPQLAGGSTVIKYRTYDLYITYDKYYQTPRLWLFGFDENRKPLSPDQVFEDISQDHANKTVTIEQHPHLSISLVSIHPCRHASVMKKLIVRMNERDGKENETIRIDQYLMIFLKFISCIVPAIDYDHTSAVRT